MPKTAMNYNATCFYKIVCNDLNVKSVYVGHTTNFTKRKCLHKHSCNKVNDKNYDLNLYRTIRDHGNWDNWSMLVIETIACVDLQDARIKERNHMENLNADLNSRLPHRTAEELQKYNKDYCVQYYLDNRESLCTRSKKYGVENKESIAVRSKLYRSTNRERIKAHKSEVHLCDCGKNYTLGHKSRHLKSKLHQAYVNSTVVV